MIERIGHPFVHILAFVKFCRPPGYLKTIAEILKLPNQIIAVIRHGGQQELVVNGIITCHELCHVRQEAMTDIQDMAPREIKMLKRTGLYIPDRPVYTGQANVFADCPPHRWQYGYNPPRPRH